MNEAKLMELMPMLLAKNIQLVAVSKMQPDEAVLDLYEQGQRDFGENRVQELLAKKERLPADIKWHMVGHLQSNKVKFIAPFIHLIHSVDKPKLLKEISKRAVKNNRVIDCLLQVHIAQKEHKFGFSTEELQTFLASDNWRELPHIRINGLMGMASFTDDAAQIKAEFQTLKKLFDRVKKIFFLGQENFQILSMGMSADYELAIAEGATIVRIGSLLFGPRPCQTND